MATTPHATTASQEVSWRDVFRKEMEDQLENEKKVRSRFEAWVKTADDEIEAEAAFRVILPKLWAYQMAQTSGYWSMNRKAASKWILAILETIQPDNFLERAQLNGNRDAFEETVERLRRERSLHHAGALDSPREKSLDDTAQFGHTSFEPEEQDFAQDEDPVHNSADNSDQESTNNSARDSADDFVENKGSVHNSMDSAQDTNPAQDTTAHNRTAQQEFICDKCRKRGDLCERPDGDTTRACLKCAERKVKCEMRGVGIRGPSVSKGKQMESEVLQGMRDLQASLNDLKMDNATIKGDVDALRQDVTKKFGKIHAQLAKRRREEATEPSPSRPRKRAHYNKASQSSKGSFVTSIPRVSQASDSSFSPSSLLRNANL